MYEEYIVVRGLDVHKETTYATVLDRDGQVLVQRKMPNEDIPRFLEPIHPEKLAMEASTYIIPLYRKLVEQGYDVTVSHPKKTRYIAKARIKSDRVDSRALAELLRLDSLPESYIPPREIAEVRERVRRRAFLVRQVTKLKVKIRGTLAYEGVKPPTAANLLGGGTKERRHIFELLREAYDLRSKIVHGSAYESTIKLAEGDSLPIGEFVQRVEDCLREVIVAMLRRKQYQKKDKIIEEVTNPF
jgi:transposase